MQTKNTSRKTSVRSTGRPGSKTARPAAVKKRTVKKAVSKARVHRVRKPIAATTKACIAMGSAVAMLVFFLTFTPSFSKTAVGGITLIGADPQVDVYGPAAPEKMVAGYSGTPKNSVLVQGTESDENVIHVYAAKGAKCYHSGTCKYAYASAQRLTVYEATMLGYKPCNICDPPEYSRETVSPAEAPAETAAPETSWADESSWTNNAAADQQAVITPEELGGTDIPDLIV